MPLPNQRLGATREEPFATELTGRWPDATALSVHLSRLPDLKLVAKRSWPLTDDLELYFEYRGLPFVVESPFARLTLVALSPSTSERTYRELEDHILSYSRVWPHQYLAASLSNLLLPSKPPGEWPAANSRMQRTSARRNV